MVVWLNCQHFNNFFGWSQLTYLCHTSLLDLIDNSTFLIFLGFTLLHFRTRRVMVQKFDKEEKQNLKTFPSSGSEIWSQFVLYNKKAGTQKLWYSPLTEKWTVKPRYVSGEISSGKRKLLSSLSLVMFKDFFLYLRCCFEILYICKLFHKSN